MELSCRGAFAPHFGASDAPNVGSYQAGANGKNGKVADKAADFWQALREKNNGNDAAMARFSEQYSSGPRPTQRNLVAAVKQPTRAAAQSGRCAHCGLPLGEMAYHIDDDPTKPLVHGECRAQLMLLKSREVEEARQQKSAAEKKARREQFGIGWKPDMVPLNAGPAQKMGRQSEALSGMFCLTLDEASNTVSLTAATEPSTAVNLEYLSLALKVRTRGGRDPLFSLDPKLGSKADSPDDLHAQWQVKRFEPAWLEGTSVGEVMFQADVHLKELSMGEYAQPVVGMKSCFEMLEQEGLQADWFAREWFIVKKAEVLLAGESGAGVLVPFVQMGVEAREQIRHTDYVEDAPITRKDHPLVKYADSFTHYFDVIAERKSVIHHVRELAKATVLAKFLVDGDVKLEDSWYELAEESQATGSLDIPQLWNERCHTSIQVCDGKIVESGKDRTCAKLRGVYGGVEFGTDRVQVVGFRRPVAAVMTEIPRGVDLNLDKFNLAAPRRLSPAASSMGGPSILQTADAQVPLGTAFWRSIAPGSDAPFSEGHKKFFQELFNPHLSDRRDEGERFVPPDTNLAYVRKLESLLHEEACIVKCRRERFCSESFNLWKADPLFPMSWAPSADIVRLGSKSKDQQLQGDSMLKLHAEMPGLERVLTQEAPVLDKVTEDGARFRVYQVGGVEVRTIQDSGAKEAISAVYSSRAPSQVPTNYSGWNVQDNETIVKALQYVESTQNGGHRYYVVLETNKGNFIATEQASNRSATWEENPANLESRNRLAKVTRSIECHEASVSVRDMRLHAREAKMGGEGYAQSVLARAKKPSGRGPVAETSCAPAFNAFGDAYGKH